MGDLLICAANLAPEIDIILLTFCLGWRGEGLFYGSVQPPLLPPTNQRGTAYHVPIGQITRERANFDPTPTCAGPDLEHDGRSAPLLPHSCVEGDGLVP